MEFISRFFRIPEQSCFLFGPRGTGKSTWLRHRLPAAKRATVAHDKLYLFDAGVFRSLRPGGPLDRAGDIDG